MAINSRAKGNRGEREVAKIFRDALGGTWERKSMGIPGPDLLCPPSFRFAVEVKHDKRIKALHTYTGSAVLTQYWKQADAQADALDLSPLLICKIEGKWLCSDGIGRWELLETWIQGYKKMIQAGIYPT